MFKLYKQEPLTAWTNLGEMNLSDGKSTVQHNISSGEIAIVINGNYCLAGTTADLKQLKAHIDIVLKAQVNNP